MQSSRDRRFRFFSTGTKTPVPRTHRDTNGVTREQLMRFSTLSHSRRALCIPAAAPGRTRRYSFARRAPVRLRLVGRSFSCDINYVADGFLPCCRRLSRRVVCVPAAASGRSKTAANANAPHAHSYEIKWDTVPLNFRPISFKTNESDPHKVGHFFKPSVARHSLVLSNADGCLCSYELERTTSNRKLARNPTT